MQTALIIGGLGIALALCAPATRALRARNNSRLTDKEYFAAARRRAISYRLAANEHAARAEGDQ